MNCVICHGEASGALCSTCARSYDRDAHDEGSIREVMSWAADRAVRLRGAATRRGRMVAISFTADELVMLRDRVSAGAEVSEEPGWAELLDKVDLARRKLAPSHRPKSAAVVAEGTTEQPAPAPAPALQCIATAGHDGGHLFLATDYPTTRDGDVRCHATAPAKSGEVIYRPRSKQQIMKQHAADREQAKKLLEMRWTKPMRLALLRKSWIPRSRSGGETLLAERLAKLGLFDKCEGEYLRTSLGHQVLVELDRKRARR